jgi:hypothetical protein
MNENYVSPYLWAGVYRTLYSIVFAKPSTSRNGDMSLAYSYLKGFTQAGIKLLNVKKAIDISIASITISNMLGQQLLRFETAG